MGYRYQRTFITNTPFLITKSVQPFGNIPLMLPLHSLSLTVNPSSTTVASGSSSLIVSIVPEKRLPLWTLNGMIVLPEKSYSSKSCTTPGAYHTTILRNQIDTISKSELSFLNMRKRPWLGRFLYDGMHPRRCYYRFRVGIVPFS